MDTKMAGTGLLSLPNELLERICGYLPGHVLVELSFTSQRLFNVCNGSQLWSRALREEELVPSTALSREAQRQMDLLEKFTRLGEGIVIEKPCLGKLCYLMMKRVRRNLRAAASKEGSIPHFHPEQVCLGFDHNHLVALESGRMRVWDISCQWVNLVSASRVNIDLSNKQQTVYQILVANGLALVCFSFGESQRSSDYQTIQGYELAADCRLAWERSGLLGSQYHVIRLFNSTLFILDLLRDRIEVCDVTLTGLVTRIILEQPGDSMRLPCGEISASSEYLVVPGRLVPENSPALSCWSLTTSTRQILTPNRPVCPFRWFQHTAVLENKVYGILNRFRLICWTAADGEVIFSLDLTDDSPGEQAYVSSWLLATKDLVLSVHQDNQKVTVLAPNGSLLGTIRPQLPEWCESETAYSHIEEVAVEDNIAVLRIYSQNFRENQSWCQLFWADLRHFLRGDGSPVAGGGGTLLAPPLVEHPHIPELAGQDSTRIIFTGTKIFDLEPVGIKFYDFLHTASKSPAP